MHGAQGGDVAPNARLAIDKLLRAKEEGNSFFYRESPQDARQAIVFSVLTCYSSVLCIDKHILESELSTCSSLREPFPRDEQVLASVPQNWTITHACDT